MANAGAQAGHLVGAVLARRFRLVRLLGEGGMGTVYAGQVLDGPATLATPLPGQVPPQGRVVALKILRPEFVGNAEVLARFSDEAVACQRLIHPNILRIFECAHTEDGAPFLVMELLEGVPLSAYTANGGRVPLVQAGTILQGMLAGLAAAHAQGIVHRDLKPENVFLAREANGQFQVKLLDFGIAKVMDVAGGMGRKTKTGALLGTPAYMSPEQVKNAKEVDARSDLWSAGVMGYEMLSGKVAFPAPTEYARLAAVLNHQPMTLDRVDPALAPISPIIARAMQKDPALRYPSALEMARALASAQGTTWPPGMPSRPPAGGGSIPEVRVAPLSRLPDVPNLYAPSTIESSPAASSERNAHAAAMMDGAAGVVGKPPGGTLPSAQQPPEMRAIEVPAPAIVIDPMPQGSTMPSKDLPMLEAVDSGKPRLARGVEPWIVLVLVICALAAGFLLGLAAGRTL